MHKIPISFQKQMERLFGLGFLKNTGNGISEKETRRVLRNLLDEIFQYLKENVQTDGLHYSLLLSGLTSSRESLKEEDYFLAYIEGLTRTIFLLMGDYPHHEKRQSGRKKSSHYKLDRLRTVQYFQNHEQKFRALLADEVVFLGLGNIPREKLGKFRDQFGFKATHREFLDWYRDNFPSDYVKVF